MEKVKQFFVNQWGSSQIVVSTGIFSIDDLDGFVSITDGGEVNGLLSFTLYEAEKVLEIVSLDSLEEGKGIGSKLIQLVEEAAVQRSCTSIKLITTNDNLHAVHFYQKRGFRLTQVFIDAVNKARKVKPQIPYVAYNGISIMDEWEFTKPLSGQGIIEK
ncbi:ribosomal protein S18 acetylase RimI-like enzyme [Salirhabdus euzebyi]|uniref:Ribosomal protein S18 acetylase RimI-like enzyme n=1 Tax=Salirhabdus euzebyi TaxID=394506 RepID=A0A841Q1Q8_9BACI|nr:GNAT family N-acetyltransferase [Salirhabdus euzebyi]MBB6452293.1 ribosomal protein S18 acetylase RimI-like enzyme [Salirhabdus euzebyi]